MWSGTADVPGSMAGGVIQHRGAGYIQCKIIGLVAGFGSMCHHGHSGGTKLNVREALPLLYQVAWIIGISFEANWRLVGYLA